jgi:hypothetical protein
VIPPPLLFPDKAISAFTRVFDALWRISAMPESRDHQK